MWFEDTTFFYMHPYPSRVHCSVQVSNKLQLFDHCSRLNWVSRSGPRQWSPRQDLPFSKRKSMLKAQNGSHRPSPGPGQTQGSPALHFLFCFLLVAQPFLLIFWLVFDSGRAVKKKAGTTTTKAKTRTLRGRIRGVEKQRGPCAKSHSAPSIKLFFCLKICPRSTVQSTFEFRATLLVKVARNFLEYKTIHEL